MAEKQGERLVRVPPSFAEKARIGSKDRYRALYDRSLVRPRRVLGRAGRAHPLVQAVGQGLALGLQDGQGRVVHRRQDQRVLQLPRPARGGPAQEQGGADQPRGLALVPPRGHWAPSLPKTRSGKIMRRILRKVAAGEFDQLGDISTLADPSVVDQLVREKKARTGR